MSVMSERDVLHEGLRELASELDSIEALIPEDLEEVSLPYIRRGSVSA
jgi:hypothetical protein